MTGHVARLSVLTPRPDCAEPRAQDIKASGLRHASRQSYAAVLGLAAAQAALGGQVTDPERLALVVAVEQPQSGPEWTFIERQIQGGWKSLDPLRFPATLPSAVSAAIAAAVQSKSCAFSIAAGAGAWMRAISLAVRLIEDDRADVGLAIAAADAPPPLAAAQRTIYPGISPMAGAVAICLGAEPRPDEALLDVSIADDVNGSGAVPVEAAMPPLTGSLLLGQAYAAADAMSRVRSATVLDPGCRGVPFLRVAPLSG
ncbi:hypothetical protein SAMN05421759_11137 [Roseivivax lentus]|uniref:Beta-ketoacyl synthase, N-terminal domain n=1 Tax=Roseivivax lentus TaxID=633194 RepID=A0A1N7NYR2_9RHOB|nr:hypothetical protein [Roseivivax lentus]SIT03426.1 hypothetical protein SAMN05421759_11137 [Roseivivax lentus]